MLSYREAMAATRPFGIRRVMTPNQVVAYNVIKARALRGWTQEQAAEALAPYLGAKLSADDLLALSRGFDLPIGYFFTPPPPETDAGLYGPDAGTKGLDPIVLLDAMLGTPDNIGYWMDDLLAYAASHAPMPRSKREKPSVSPADLPQRLAPLVDARARALLRNALGDLDSAGDLLERLAEALRLLDEAAQSGIAGPAAPAGTDPKPTRARRSATKK